MIAKAELRFVRGSAKKIRQVLDVIRGMSANEAVEMLRLLNKRSTYFVGKLLKSAIANAKVKGIESEDLFVSRIVAEEGPRWKRYRARAFGRASEILKRTSHVFIELDLKNGKKMPIDASLEAAPKKTIAAKLMPKRKKTHVVSEAAKKKTVKKKKVKKQ